MYPIRIHMNEMQSKGEHIALCQTNAYGASPSYKKMKNIFDIDLTSGDESELTAEEDSIEDEDQEVESEGGNDPFDYMNTDPFVRL
jgi:hypothetical protein